MALFGWLRREQRESLGAVRIAVDGEGWRFDSDLDRRLLSVALFHYWERLLVAAGEQHGGMVCEALARGLEKLVQYETDEMLVTRHLRQSLFRDWLGTFVTRSDERWSMAMAFYRRRDSKWPGGFYYTEETTFSPGGCSDLSRLRLLTSSLVVFYEEAFSLDDFECSHFLLRTLQNQLLFYKSHGLPTESRLGRAANIAALQYFGLEQQPEAEVAEKFRAYLGG